MAVQPIPDGYHTLTPYMVVRGASEAIEFYIKAFGATEVMRMPMPDGNIAHAEIRIGDSVVMMSEENPMWGTKSPQTLGGSACSLMFYVDDVDAVFAQAIAAGATEKMAVTNHFYGDRSGSLVDPFGHEWMISTHVEDVPPEEMQKRMEDWAAQESK